MSPVISPYPSNVLWPAEWQGATLTGQFLDILGYPIIGKISLRPAPAAVIALTAKKIILSAAREVQLDYSGAFTVTVPATDDPDVNPTGWTYRVTENFPGGRSYDIPAPMNTVTDITALVPVPSSTGNAIVRGASAYDIAVRNGYTGTEAQWIASLGGSGGVATVGLDTDGRPYFDPNGVPSGSAVTVLRDTDTRPYFVI